MTLPYYIREGIVMFKVVMCYDNGTKEEEDELFETQEAAYEYGLYMCSCFHEGAEILNLSNPGDYPLEESGDIDFEVIEVNV
jgi:hypothetical protein